MAQSIEDARSAYDAAHERLEAARADLRAAKEELDEFHREEAAENHAVFLGFERGDEAGIQAAKTLLKQRREMKARIHESALNGNSGEADGPVGGFE